ncbi:hypothetical protein ACFOY5_18525 [Massilia aurea]|jgi:hypothetical protein|uniref:hypothetical protein n=1 Tax=Massilia aurea TaxID=373040 RepID=UPI002161853A|nr:hypothetical protein [Massilia aurea]MCS0707876.1 hypothetical protein [Massilia aurea]
MRLSHLALFAAAAVVSLASAAQPVTATNPDVVNVQAAQPKKVYIDPLMYKRMQGAYKLEDGRTLHVTGKSRKLYADLGDGPQEIVHVGRDRFEAVGRDLSVRFDGGPFPHTVHLKDDAGRVLASSQR